MDLTSWIRRARRDPSSTLGIAGGVLTSLVGIVGYVVVPVLSGNSPTLVDASVNAATTPTRFSAAYHVTVMVVPAFVLAFVGSLLLSRWGLTGRRQELRVLGGIVSGPVVTVSLGYVVTAIGVGFTFSSGDLWSGTNFLLEMVFTYWALLFGLLFLAIVLSGVTIAGASGAIAGYFCATVTQRVLASPRGHQG